MSTAAAPAHGVPAIHRDYQGAKIGMWIFLLTEIILFGGMGRLSHSQLSHSAVPAPVTRLNSWPVRYSSN